VVKKRRAGTEIEFVLAIIIAILLIVSLIFQQSLQIPFQVVSTLLGAFIIIKLAHIIRKGGTVFEDYISLVIIALFFVINFIIKSQLNNTILVVIILTLLYSVGIIPSVKKLARSKSITAFLISYFIFVIAIILLFAGTFTVNESNFTVEGELASLSFADALYFSTITFTTIGYGDIAPIGINRLLASLEAIFGLIMNIAFIGYVLSSRRFIPEKRERKSELILAV